MIEICGVPFKVAVVGIEQSRHEVECTTSHKSNMRWKARLNR